MKLPLFREVQLPEEIYFESNQDKEMFSLHVCT